MAKYTPIRPNFIYPTITDAHRTFGAALTGPILREDGDWRSYLPPTELQNIGGVESSACYIEAQQHALATIKEEEFGVVDENYSARFNALLSNGTPGGGDPVKGASSIKNDGMIPDSLMPFDGSLQSWDDFHSWKGADEGACRRAGKAYLKKWEENYKIEVERKLPIATKYRILKEVLKRCPVPLSVAAWYEQDGVYIKPEGVRDNHLVEAVYLDEQNRIHVRDTYPPFDKILAPNYNFDFAMSWVVKKRAAQPSLLSRLMSFFKKK